MDISTVLGVVVALLALVALAGTAHAWQKSNYAKTLVELLKSEVSALTDKATRLDGESADCLAKYSVLEVRYDGLTQKHDDLRSLVLEAFRGQTTTKARAIRKQLNGH